MEIWDAYDEKRNKIDGVSLVRGEPINEGYYKDSIVLQDGETSSYKWISGDELRFMSRDELATQRIQNFIEELR